MKNTQHSQPISNISLENTRVTKAAGLFKVFALLLLLFPTLLTAQTDTPQLELQDSRGNVLTDELTIGRSLYVSGELAEPGATYRFTLATPSGETVDQRKTTAGPNGLIEKNSLFYKSNIGTVGCLPQGNGTVVGTPSDVLGPFDSLSEAVAELDGLTLWFSAELRVEDPTGGPDFWAPILAQPISMKAPLEAIYYWSSASGEAKCFASVGEALYLSVYKGYLEEFDFSRVFMIKKPGDKAAWNSWDGNPETAPEFHEMRNREGCFLSKDESCLFENGSFETLPNTATIQVQGLLPPHGQYLAVVRPASANGETAHYGWTRNACDRSTESTLYIDELPQLTEAQEGWGCPPCPG